MGFGNWLILSQSSACCLMHAKHLGPVWACEWGQGVHGRHVAWEGRAEWLVVSSCLKNPRRPQGTKPGAGSMPSLTPQGVIPTHLLHPSLFYIRPPSPLSLGLSSHPCPQPRYPTPPSPSQPCSHPSPMPRVNKPSISCSEKEHTAFARLIHPELLSQPLPGPLARSLHPLGPASPPPEMLLSISSLPRWSQLLSLTVFSLVVYFLPFLSTSSLLLHSFPDLGLLCVASQGCPVEEGRKEAQRGAPMSPSGCLSLLSKAWDLQGKRAAVSCRSTC